MFITDLWKRQPGKFFFLCTKSGSGAWREKAFARAELKEVGGFIERNHDKDVYFCPHGFDAPQRRKTHAVLPKLLWSDMDEANPRTCAIKPSVAIESSPGRYVGIWFLDATMTEDLNRRMTYALEADHGGWDLTQVLRVPDTTNYKYASNPEVRLLWNDDTIYRVADIEKKLPKEKPKLKGPIGLEDLIHKHRFRLSPSTRNELRAHHVTVGKRSDMLWKMENDMFEKGIPREDALMMVKLSVWNKFAGRASEDEQLEREIEKVYGTAGVNGHSHADTYNFLARSMDQVEERNIDWLWYPYLARGEVTIVEGDPGVGKSYLVQMIAKAICDKEKLPSTRPVKRRGGPVAYFDAENDVATVTKKRLLCNGFITESSFYQEEEPFTIDDLASFDKVYNALEKMKPTLVVFDTINLYIGGANTDKASETTQALAKFKDIARRLQCCVVIVRHLTKGGREKALYRGQGSIAFTGVARIVLTVGCDPEDDTTKVISVTKNNLVKHPRALAFSIRPLPDTLRETDRSKFEWGGYVDFTSDQIIGKSNGGGEKKIEVAKDFIREALKEGTNDAGDIERMAEAKGISVRTMKRASEELSVVKTRVEGGKHKVLWSM